MRLKELRLKGFKSFANDTRIQFNEQIIGIVGPNGSGKSNIVDAIRWVLGEQKNRELRLDNSTDVIFNGTKARKKAGIAEVSMVFDNTKNIIPTEFKHVEIGRGLYRSGDSEYKMNGVICRRKDIRNLFIDTGIGSNSYAIIQLGMVEDILLDKDNARRKMFEQAAGISKFKARKHETLLKLKNTENDLERIKDILHELEINMKTLERQAKRTKKYYEIKENYKTLSITLSSTSYRELNKTITEVNIEITKQEDQFRGLNTVVLNLESEVEKLKVTNLEKEQSLSQFQKDFNLLIDELRKAESQKQINQKEYGYSNQSLDKADTSFQEIDAELKTLELEIEPLKSSKEISKTELASLTIDFEKAKEKFEKSKLKLTSLNGDSSTRTQKVQEFEEQLFKIEKGIIIAENELERSRNQILHDDKNKIELNNQFTALKSQLDGFESSLSQLAANKAEVEMRSRNNKENLELATQKIEAKNHDILNLEKQKEVKSNEQNLLKDMIENLEGFPDSAKFLINQWKKKAVILSDIFDIEAAYKTGLEIFLEPYLNYFIAENYGEAMGAVQLLTDAQKGKSQFFILDQIRTSVSYTDLNIAGLIPAMDVLKVEDKYKPLAKYLLNGVYFTSNWSEDMYTKITDGITIIDKSGKFIINKRTLKGGSVGLFEGKKIGRKKSLQKLEKEIKDLEFQIQTERSEYEQLIIERKELESQNFETEIGSLLVEIENVIKEKVQAETNIFVIQSNIEKIASQKVEIDQLIQLKQNEVLNLEREKEAVRNNLNNINRQIDEDTGELEKIRSEVESLTQTYNQSNIHLIQKQNIFDNLNQEITFKEDRIIKLTEDRSNLQNEIATLKDSITQSSSKDVHLEESLKQLYERKEAMESNLGTSEQNYFNEKSEINDKENSIQKNRQKLNDLQSKVNARKSDLQSLQFDLKAIPDRLSIEFNLTKEEIEEILNSSEEIENFEEMKEKVVKLKKRIENYGEINPLAVQAFDEVSERHVQICEQRDDIVEAKVSLLETITEIENSASEKFMEAFDQVAANFKDVFRSLFSEDDDCSLVLRDTENPLNSEIEIVARPKGKRPKTLKQLSGGESTLTATALLFSLYLLKPAPFCIFDEVDAPLDDHNVQKFTKLIREFSKHSQFIIITHNKSTMAAVDTLYGVYMQEKGVSGITQVDFREYEHEEVFKMANN